MNRGPTVSVIIATHNRYQRLTQALRSVFAQTYGRLEIVVVNDGSSDPEYGSAPPPGVKWIDLPGNTRRSHGYPCPGFVRNVGVAAATGEYLAILDDDDRWLPHKIETQLKALRSSGNAMSCTEVYATNGAPSSDLEYPWYFRDCIKVHLPDELTERDVELENFIAHSSVLMRRDLFERAGPYAETPRHGHGLRGAHAVEDWSLWRKCLKETHCRYVAEPLAYLDCRYWKLDRLSTKARIALLRAARTYLGVPHKIKVGT